MKRIGELLFELWHFVLSWSVCGFIAYCVGYTIGSFLEHIGAVE